MEESDATEPREVTDPHSANPQFRKDLAASIVGRRVRVEATDGKRFEGDLESFALEDRHVLLRDVEELPGGASAPSAFVAAVDWIVPVDDEPE